VPLAWIVDFQYESAGQSLNQKGGWTMKEQIVALFSGIVSGIVVAIINYFFTR